MDPIVIKAVSDSVKYVVETMTMTPATLGAPLKKGDACGYDGVTGIIGLAGSNANGSLLVSFSDETIFHLLENMFGEKFSEVGDEVLDAVGEMVNILCGDLKRRLAESDYKIDMATPLVIHGRHLQIRDRINRETVVIPCTTAGGPFVVETNLAKTKG